MTYCRSPVKLTRVHLEVTNQVTALQTLPYLERVIFSNAPGRLYKAPLLSAATHTFSVIIVAMTTINVLEDLHKSSAVNKQHNDFCPVVPVEEISKDPTKFAKDGQIPVGMRKV